MRLFLLWVVLGVASPIGGMTCAADMRKWTSADGKFSAEAKFVELVGDTAFLENAAGKKLRVPLAKLSAADRQYVEKLTQPPKSKPELDPPTPTPETPPVASAEPTTNVPATVDQQIDWILQASDDGEFEKVAEFAPGGAMITVAISDDGQHIVACEIGGDCRSWDVATGKQIARYEKKLGAGHHRAAISPDGKYGLLGTPTGEVHVWDATTGKHLFTHEAPEGAVQVVSVSNDGKKMGALDNTGQIVSFPLLGGMGNTLKLEERGRGAVYFDLSPNGEFFVAGRTFEADAIQGFFPQGGADGINFDLPLADQHIISVDIHPRFAAMIVEKNCSCSSWRRPPTSTVRCRASICPRGWSTRTSCGYRARAIWLWPWTEWAASTCGRPMGKAWR